MTKEQAQEIIGFDPMDSKMTINEAYTQAKNAILSIPNNKFSGRYDKLALLEKARGVLSLPEQLPASISATEIVDLADETLVRQPLFYLFPLFKILTDIGKKLDRRILKGSLIFLVILAILLPFCWGAGGLPVVKENDGEKVDTICIVPPVIPDPDSVISSVIVRRDIDSTISMVLEEYYEMLNILVNFEANNTGVDSEIIKEILEDKLTKYKSFFHEEALRSGSKVIEISNIRTKLTIWRSVADNFSTMINLSNKYEVANFELPEVSIFWPDNFDLELLQSQGQKINAKGKQVFYAHIQKDANQPDYADETIKVFRFIVKALPHGDYDVKILQIGVDATRSI